MFSNLSSDVFAMVNNDILTVFWERSSCAIITQGGLVFIQSHSFYLLKKRVGMHRKTPEGNFRSPYSIMAFVVGASGCFLPRHCTANYNDVLSTGYFQ